MGSVKCEQDFCPLNYPVSNGKTFTFGCSYVCLPSVLSGHNKLE